LVQAEGGGGLGGVVVWGVVIVIIRGVGGVGGVVIEG
jgi:hypothetical protein